MAVYMVTGGAGFIGSNIVEALVTQGHSVKVLDNLSTGKKENLKHIAKDVELCEIDIRDLEEVKKVCAGVDFVLHQAALRAVLRSVDDPQETNDVNVTGTLNVLLAARDQDVKRVVFASSSSVYGDNPALPKIETMIPEPISPYAASKIMGEYYAKIFYKLYGLETVSLRYFNVFGPRQNPESKYSAVIPIFIDCLSQDRSPDVHGDGEQSRDFSYVDNVVAGNLLAATAPNVAGEVFNIACHEQYSVNDIYKGISHILGKHISPVYTDARAGDVRHTFADITKAEEKLKYTVLTHFDEGLKKTVDWFMREYKG